MRTLYAFLLLLWGTASAFAQDITRVEYFIDSDPGFGAGTEISVDAGLSQVDLSFQVPLSSLSAGLHRLFIRAKDSDNKWSLVSHHLFYKDSFSALTLPDIVKVEYFIDNDPGFGSATDVPLTAASNVNDLEFSFPLTSLSDGLHKLFIRAKNALGNWSVVQIKTFSKQSNGIAIKGFPVNWCIGSSIEVGFVSTGTFSAGNEFKIQISDYNGVFPTDFNTQIIGSVASTSVSGTIPVSIVAGSGVFAGNYKVRAIATNSAVPSVTNVFSEEILVIVAATCPCVGSDLSASVSVTQPIACTGEATAKILATANGGTAPYQFRVDGGEWQFDPKFAGMSIGTHTVESRDVNWCTTSDNVDIVFDATLAIDGDESNVVLPDGKPFNFSGNDCRLIATVQGVGLSNGTTPFSASVTIEEDVKVYAGQPYLQRHFEFTPGGTNPTDATITIYLRKAEMLAFNAASTVKLPVEAGDDKSKLRIWQWHGAVVEGAADVTIDPLDANITWDETLEAWKVKFHVDGFSSFYITAENAVPLPVTLLSFEAKKQENSVMLRWQTTFETKSEYFEIQRSRDARTWSPIGEVKAMGESKSLASYFFVDNNPSSDITSSNSYYRLKMVDIDKTFAYSRIVSAGIDQNSGIRLYPNPARNLAVVESAVPITSYQLTSVAGIKVKAEANLNTNTLHFSLDNVSSGLYILRLSTIDGVAEYRKLIVK